MIIKMLSFFKRFKRKNTLVMVKQDMFAVSFSHLNTMGPSQAFEMLTEIIP